MAHTIKWEHPTDGWHIGHRIERKARPAGRLKAVIEMELALDEPTPEEIAEEWAMEREALEWQERYWNEMEQTWMEREMLDLLWDDIDILGEMV